MNASVGARHDEGILDTSTVVLLSKLDLSMLPQSSLVTTLTLAELAVGPLVANEVGERARRQAHLQQAEADFAPLPFDTEAARAFGHVAAQMRQAGRKRASRTYDALIAAIAVARGLPLYTSNPGDFEGIEGLEVVPVPVPA